jgi:hypothetical protein
LIELHLRSQAGMTRQHTALVRIKSGACCNAGFRTG